MFFCLMHTLVLEDDFRHFVIIILLFCLQLLNHLLFHVLSFTGESDCCFGDYFSIAYIAPWDLGAFKIRQPWNGGARGSLQDGVASTVLYLGE